MFVSTPSTRFLRFQRSVCQERFFRRAPAHLLGAHRKCANARPRLERRQRRARRRTQRVDKQENGSQLCGRGSIMIKKCNRKQPLVRIRVHGLRRPMPQDTGQPRSRRRWAVGPKQRRPMESCQRRRRETCAPPRATACERTSSHQPAPSPTESSLSPRRTNSQRLLQPAATAPAASATHGYCTPIVATVLSVDAGGGDDGPAGERAARPGSRSECAEGGQAGVGKRPNRSRRGKRT